MLTSIVILTFNQLDYTKQCIESIRRFTRPGSYEIIIVDNGSDNSTREWLIKQEDIKMILNDENLGFPKGCNQGIEVAGGDSILLLNNDVVVTKNWLENMLLALNSDEKIGAVSCVTNSCSYNQAIPTEYHTLDQMHIFAENFNLHNPLKWEERLKLVGFCLLIKKNVINKIGLLDERFTPGNYEDDDYSIRIRQAGFKLLLCKDTFIHHYGSVSFRGRGQDLKYQQLLNKNKLRFTKKWGFDATYSQHVRNELIELIVEPADTSLCILEVGCACGGTLLGIKNKYKQSKLYGIELNKHSAEIASLIAEMHEADIEKDSLPYQEEYFDYVIFADVLEHMSDPWAALQNIRKHLKPEGKILMSLPNIMHFSVISKLIMGTWEYEDSGILDKTHLRFFTLNEIYKMAITTGYEINYINGTTLNSTQEAEKIINQFASMGGQERKEQFRIYQYIAVLSKDQADDILNNLLDEQNNPQVIYETIKELDSQKLIDKILHISDYFHKVELLNTIGVVHFQMGNYEEVLPFLYNAYQLDLTNKEVVYNIAYFLQFIGEKEEASPFEDILKQLDQKYYYDYLSVISNGK